MSDTVTPCTAARQTSLSIVWANSVDASASYILGNLFEEDFRDFCPVPWSLKDGIGSEVVEGFVRCHFKLSLWETAWREALTARGLTEKSLGVLTSRNVLTCTPLMQ